MRTAPINVADAPVAELPPTSDMWVAGARRRVLAHDPASDAITYVSQIPAGYRRQAEVAYRRSHEPGRFEHHSCHEEGFILTGRYDFGGWYRWDALSYLNHPSTWVHPADQCAPQGAILLMKLSGPLDFAYVDIPAGWDGVEYAAEPERAAPYRGVSSLRLDAADPGVADASGRRWRRLWDDPVRGWTTWLVRAEPGWRGRGDVSDAAGGDELFVLSGAVRTRVGDEVVVLREGDYVCEPDRFCDGGAEESSDAGFVAIRWTRGVDPLRDHA